MRPGRAFTVLQDRAVAGRSHDEHGYVLMIALGVIGLTFLSIIALLGLALTTSRVTVTQRETTVRNRAADAGLDAAITSISRGSTTPCDAVPDGSAVPGVDSQGTRIDVEIECEQGTGAEISEDPEADFGGDGVFIADRSQGALQSTAGPPVRFDSDVRVRGGATGPSVGSGPAVAVAGQYRQGLAGVGVADQSSRDCGPLSTPADPQRIADRDDRPECGWERPDGTPLVDAEVPRPQDRLTFPTTAATVPSACPSANPVVLSPGFYGPVAVRQLNTLIRTCGAKTFVFSPASGVGASPGDSRYFLDANDPAAGADRGALVVDNPQATLIFGVPVTGPASGVTSPRCDRTRSGASIVLSGRTSLQHRSGTLAVCPATGLPAIVQVPNAPVAPVIQVTSSQFTNPAQPNATLALTDPVTPAYRSMGGTPNSPCVFLNPPGACRTGQFQFRATNLPVENIEQLHLMFNSVETPRSQSEDRNVRIQITGLPASVGTITCDWAALGRTPGLGTAIDLVACAPVLQGKPASVLEGATTTVTVRYGREAAVVPFPEIRLGIWDLHLEVNPERVSPTAAVLNGWNPPTDGVFRYEDSVVSPFQAVTSPGLPGAAARYGSWAAPDSTRTLEVRNLTVDDVAFRERNVELTSADLVLASRAPLVTAETYPTSSSVSDSVDGSSLTVRVARTGVELCTFQLAGYGRSSRPIRIPLLDQSTCAEDLLRSGDLNGLDVTLTYRIGCALTPTAPIVDPATGNCLTIRVPDAAFVGLEATTDVLSTPPPSSLLTVDSTGASGRRAEAHVYGDTLISTSDLQVRWRGGVPGQGASFSAPLVVGNLQVGRIISQTDSGASVGSVCCYLPNPFLGRIQAIIDGRVWAETLVEVSTIDGTGSGQRPVEILDWRFCGALPCGPRRTEVAPP